VFTILGHNGAGKTTVMQMLAGVYKPSEGDAIVYGSSVREDSETVQAHLGVCYQFDVFSDKLTVRDHLVLACEIKNIPKGQIKSTVEETL